MKAREVAPLLSTPAMGRAATLMSAAAAVLLLAAAAGWVFQRPWFDVRQIELRAAGADGLRHVNEHAVRAAATGRLRGNFFTMRLEEARRVFESVPWVAAVSLRRAWPDRLVVTLTDLSTMELEALRARASAWQEANFPTFMHHSGAGQAVMFGLKSLDPVARFGWIPKFKSSWNKP